jgi:hypothetical protein
MKIEGRHQDGVSALGRLGTLPGLCRYCDLLYLSL